METKMEGIDHKMIRINGLDIHIAEMGEGPVVLLLHGFPELWYSWRHQILFLAAHGYRAVAPDLRGYGDTQAEPVTVPTKYTTLHVVGELVALIDAIGADKVFVVGHDWGAAIAWRLCLFRPDKVKALVNLSLHYAPRNHLPLTVETYRVHCETEVKLSLLGIKKVLETYMAHRGPSPFNFPNFITFFVNGSGFDYPRVVILPSWLSEEDVDYYTKKFKKTGFRQAMNYVYRYLDLTWELEAPWLEAKVNVPAKFIVGESDWAYHKPGVKQYIESGEFKKNVPMLEEVVVIQGAAHFINQEVPDKINTHIYDFFQKFKDT